MLVAPTCTTTWGMMSLHRSQAAASVVRSYVVIEEPSPRVPFTDRQQNIFAVTNMTFIVQQQKTERRQNVRALTKRDIH